MLNTNRRTFLIHVACASSAMAVAGAAQAQAAVLETDPVASSLGYKADASKVDPAKQPKYAAGQNCANCALFQGKAGAATGGCVLFAGKQVSAKAWCNAWVKKA